ncbi:MAG TPA: FKBP-type peptidyl-prolyl cis-trans isomerase, partial [Sphingobacterium sp.]|nr:FKBP-type peptidyl-prolyl cis-trans isomerase [Sphingobacterium sp.]
SSIIQQHFRVMMEKRNAALRKPGEEYLANLKNNPNIQATSEGLLYEVLVQGDGRKPQTTDKVKVHYAGYLIDGTKFDSSYDRGQSIDFELDRVIAGWTIGVSLMNIGSKYKLYIPYHLGYGERGTGNIPPFSTLIFEIELLDIVTPNEVQ